VTKAKKILEEYERRVKFRGKSIEIFSNPSKNELEDMYPYIKFIADNRDKKVWAWNGWDGPLHAPMWAFTLSKDLKKDILAGHVLAGYAKMGNKRIKPVMDDGDADATTENYFTKNDVDKIADKFKWVNAYIEVDSFIRNYGKR